MICRYCGEDKKLVKAHAIPEAFFGRLRNGQDPPRLLTNTENSYPERAPIGIYDRTILCAECEAHFGDWDNYAQDILGPEPKGATQIAENGKVGGYEISGYRYDLLKLFFVSLLWRSSISTHKFYSKVMLGPFEATAKSFVERRDPGVPEDFSVTVAKFDHPFGESILDPHAEKWDHVNYYRFYLGSYVVYIKADKRKTPEPHASFMMKPNEPLRIIRRDLERSKELPLIHNIAMAANPAFQRTRRYNARHR